jgi:hypothetical protein
LPCNTAWRAYFTSRCYTADEADECLILDWKLWGSVPFSIQLQCIHLYPNTKFVPFQISSVSVFRLAVPQNP